MGASAVRGTTPRKIAVVGGGWAGLAAAVEAVRCGHAVTLHEMAPQLGGRARSVTIHGERVDNGQHILIGAYSQTLRLLEQLGVAADTAFLRTPLCLRYPDGSGLQLGPGPPVLALGRAVLRRAGWTWADRLALLGTAANWSMRGFRCDPAWTVATLTRHLPASIRQTLIDPLCVAALNTPAVEASAAVFLRVLQDAVFGGPGSSDLLLPRVDLSRLLPDPALRLLRAAGTTVRLAHRVLRLARSGSGWLIDDEPFDRVILACAPSEAARLTAEVAPDWSATASALRYEPIVTVYLHSAGLRLAAPMLALHDGDDAPAQFVFDRGQLGGATGLLAFVISGAQRWVDRGIAETEAAVGRQARSALGAQVTGQLFAVNEKRATFRCTPALRRPAAAIAPGLTAAGDHVAGPYPATLEGAVRSGVTAARSVD